MSADGNAGVARRRGRLLVFLPLAVFAGLGAAFYWGLWNDDDRLPSPLVGKSIPEFELPPIEGRDDGLSSADLRGQVSIVNVWASWCVPCRVEMPLLMELAEDGSVPIYGINFKDDGDQALAFLAVTPEPDPADPADAAAFAFVFQEVGITGQTALKVAQLIAFKAEQWRGLGPLIERERLAAFHEGLQLGFALGKTHMHRAHPPTLTATRTPLELELEARADGRGRPLDGG